MRDASRYRLRHKISHDRNEKPARWSVTDFSNHIRMERVMTEATIHPKTILRQQAKREGLTRYYTSEPCKNGHLMERIISNGRCVGCLREWKKANRAIVNKAQQKHREANAEHWRKLGRKYYWDSPEKHRNAARNAARKKALCKPKLRIKYRTPIMRDLANRMRCRIWYSLNRKKGKSLADVLDYSLDELVRHIERQFTAGMSWDNRSNWEIDHIVPVATFSFQGFDDPEFRACWALSNLRPLWKEDNRKKSYRRLYLI
jgi:hypothetical protein